MNKQCCADCIYCKRITNKLLIFKWYDSICEKHNYIFSEYNTAYSSYTEQEHKICDDYISKSQKLKNANFRAV